MKHEIDLGRWFVSNERENGVWLESGSGTGMLISVHEDSPNVASIAFCQFDGECCFYFNLNNLEWSGEFEAQNKVYRNVPFVTAETRHTVDKLSNFRCLMSSTTNSIEY